MLMPKKMRELFAVMVSCCELAQPHQLWVKFREDMSEDLLYKAKQLQPNAQYNEHIFNQALTLIEDHLLDTSNRTLEHYGFPPFERERQTDHCREIIEETIFDEGVLQSLVEERTPSLTPDQEEAIGAILGMINGESTHKILFMDAPGGTGRSKQA